MASVKQLLLQCFLHLTLGSLLFPIATVTSAFPTSLPDCPDKCGNITIPYPFGIGDGCYRDDGFALTCNDFTTPPKPFLGDFEVIDINTTSAEVRVVNVIGYSCFNQTSWVNFSNSGFRNSDTYLFSNKRNRFTAIGCYTLAYIAGQSESPYQSGCVSFCNGLNSTTDDGGSCNGLGCCQTTIPTGLSYYEVQWGFNNNEAWSFSPCSYALLMQEDWYHFSIKDLVEFGFYERNKNKVPVVLDWAIRKNGTCLSSHVESSVTPVCQSEHSGCDNTTNGDGYICKCLQGYEGNPYLLNGCTGETARTSKEAMNVPARKAVEVMAKLEHALKLSPTLLAWSLLQSLPSLFFWVYVSW